MTDSSSQLSTLRRENAALKIQSLRHHRQRRELFKEATHLASDLTQASEQAEQLRRETEKARQEAAKGEQEAQQALRRKAEIEQLLSSKAQDMMRLVKTMEQRETQLELTSRQAAQQEAEAKRLAALVAELEKKGRGAEGAARLALQGEMQAYQRELEATKKKAEALEQSNAKASREVTELRETVRQKDDDILQLQEEMASKRRAVEVESEQLRARVAELEREHRSTGHNEARLAELEKVNEQLRASDERERRLREQETVLLRERVRAVEAEKVEDLEKLNAELAKREREAAERAAAACELLKIKLEHTTKELAKTKAVTAQEVRDRERKLAELERTKRELAEREAEERRRLGTEMEEMRRCVLRLERELQTAKVGAPENVRRVKELERLNEALRLRGMQAEKQLAAATPSTPQPASFALACIRVDIEAFHEKVGAFKPLSSSVAPDSLERIFHTPSPLYSAEDAKFSRVVIKLVNSAIKVRDIESASLVHRGGHAHALKVVKVERSSAGAAVVGVLDWDGPEGNCYCLRPTKSAGSGPMALHATLRLLNGGHSVRIEVPLSLKRPPLVERVHDDARIRLGLHRIVADQTAHGHVNVAWFDLLGGERLPVRDPKRVVAFQGYLGKRCSRRSSAQVSRFFALAPPFLLCYDDLKDAQKDFAKGRVLPHGANRAMRLTSISTIKPRPEGEFEFVIETPDKAWSLAASNKEDMDRWIAVIQNWVRGGGSGKSQE